MRPKTTHVAPQKYKTCKRDNTPGHAHELTFTCFQRLPLLSKDRTRKWLIESISRARDRHEFDVWAYVIMPEHVHLLIHPRTDEYSISRILHAIKWPVSRWALEHLRQANSRWIERLTDRQPSGRTDVRFWQRGGGYDRNVERKSTLWPVIDYIHNNPVRRGLVDDPIAWAWSSAAWYDGRRDVPLAVDETLPLKRQ